MRVSDRSLIALCAVGLAVVGILLADSGPEASGAGISSGVSIGTVTQAHAGVRRRTARQLTWEPLQPGDTAFDNDTVFVPPGADAVLYLRDGSRLSLEPNSLIVLQAPEQSLSVFVARGGVVGLTERAPLVFASDKGALQLEGRGRVQVSTQGSETRVDLYSGNARAAGETITANEGLTLGGRKEAYATTLLTPTAGQRVFNRKVRFDWRGPGKAKISDSPALYDAPFERELGPGAYTWRVVGPNGEALSPPSPFVVAEDAPPRGTSPRHLELLGKQRFDAVPFMWTRTPGAERYVLEISDNERFAEPKRVETTATRVWVNADFAEGVMYWRVRAEGRERPPIVSAVHAFRFKHSLTPEAPEVLDPEVDLGAH